MRLRCGTLNGLDIASQQFFSPLLAALCRPAGAMKEFRLCSAEEESSIFMVILNVVSIRTCAIHAAANVAPRGRQPAKPLTEYSFPPDVFVDAVSGGQPSRWL
jgi:hypothetical protein